jgi:membrane protein YdbS with pleckstrin-like domain
VAPSVSAFLGVFLGVGVFLVWILVVAGGMVMAAEAADNGSWFLVAALLLMVVCLIAGPIAYVAAWTVEKQQREIERNR